MLVFCYLQKYEKRSYVTTMWVSTPVEGQDSIHLIEATNRLKDFWNKQKSKGESGFQTFIFTQTV